MPTKQNQRKETAKAIPSELIERLSDENGIQRRSARMKLEEMGFEATPYLIKVLSSGKENARWKAVKALIKIKDPTSGDALCDALMDESFEVQWLAAEALIELGINAIKPLLLKLLHHYESPYLLQDAHHVL